MKFFIILLSIIPTVTTATIKLPPNINSYFSKGRSSCFVIKKINESKTHIFNEKQCNLRKEPFSTFKILNSLIGLETGVVTPNTIIPWDKKKKFLKTWEKNHNLKSAIKYSVVPFYQEVARRIGSKNMQKYIDLSAYGNKQIGTQIDKFWLDGPIQISATEQLRLMEKLYLNQLPFKKEHQEFVKNILINEQDESRVISGKTGSSYKNGHFIFGWFVGHLKKGTDEYIFVINSEGQGESGSKLKKVANKILQDMSL